MNTSEGHRERLRQKFKENPYSLTDTERLELLLIYAIPRKDVAPLAQELMSRFGTLEAVIVAHFEQLIEINGVGESTAIFIQLLHSILVDTHEVETDMSSTKQNSPAPQLNLFEIEPEVGKQIPPTHGTKKQPSIKERQMRVFANDEIANSLTFLPQAANFNTLEDFNRFLYEKLPYNAAETRQRRANYIIERFYPENNINIPLTYFAAHCSKIADIKPVVFYHILKAEVIAAKTAEELIWPALPIGQVDREQLRELVLQYMPDTKTSSQAKILQAIYHTYDLCNIGTISDQILRFQLHQGTLESFLYVLTGEYPKPGMYSFDNLFNSPVHHWMLWDRNWMRLQLYNLQDFGILSKVSEIDTMRQFTLALDQSSALRQFFGHPARGKLAIREAAMGKSEGQEV